MVISSIVLTCNPSHLRTIAIAVGAMPEAEISGRQDPYLVVITETVSRRSCQQLLENMAQLPGVIAAAPVFLCSETGEALPVSQLFTAADAVEV